MKKHLLALSIVCMPLLVMAEQRSDTEIMSIVRNMATHSSVMHRAPSFSNPVIAERTDAYVAVNTANGFVLVGADDRIPEVLGWTDNGVFDRDNLPPALLEWLNEYEKEAQYLANNMPVKRSSIAVSSDFFEDEQKPLLTTQWNQHAPYNNLCPEGSSDEHCLTGCVATATAQIMNYYKYPMQGTGSHSYKWLCDDCGSYYNDSVMLSADFGSTTYDWSHMKNDYLNGTYSEEDVNAVTTLMYHCGVMAEMNYGKEGSGADIRDAASGLITHMGYNNDMHLLRKDCYIPEQLMTIIHDDLQKKHPVLVRGDDGKGSGHAFVCDGYTKSGFFHFNWGWGGMGNGYFLLAALNPLTPNKFHDYNNEVKFIINIHPDTMYAPALGGTYTCDSIKMVSDTVARNEKLNLTAYWPTNDNVNTFVGRSGILLSDANTKERISIVWKRSELSSLPCGWGWKTLENIRFSIPAAIPEGNYLLDIVFRMEKDSIGSWDKVIYFGGAEYGLKIKVTDSIITRVYDPVSPVGFPNNGDTISCAETNALIPYMTEKEEWQQTNTVIGYVTNMLSNGISRGQQRFWMSDAPNGGNVFQCYWGNVTEEVFAGDKVAITGHLMRYDDMPEIKNGNVVLLERPERMEGVAEGALNGAFSINAEGDKVYFSQGNLQYNAATKIWRFANQQYECVGTYNGNVSATYTGWIDLFGWGTSGWNSGATAYQPYATNATSMDYSPGGNAVSNLTGAYAEADWGIHNAISNGGDEPGLWRTLKSIEWDYILTNRPNAADLQGQATINDIHRGYVLLPDNFVIPEGLNFTPQPNSWITNSYDLEQWRRMEQAGAVFLPAAGIRWTEYATGEIITNLPGYYGYYWSTKPYGASYAKCFFFSWAAQELNHYVRSGGLSVRLVYNLYPHDVEQVTNDQTPITTKILRDGQILILRDDKVYTLQGQEIK